MRQVISLAMTESAPHLSHAPRPDDAFTVDVTGLDPKGNGTAQLWARIANEPKARRFVFTMYRAVPGDRVDVRVVKRRRNQVRAIVERIVTPSPDRVAPRCAHFGHRDTLGQGCGGCSLQTLSVEAQLRHKREAVLGHFRHHALDTSVVAPALGLDPPWFYRNKMEFSIGRQRDDRFAVGMHPGGYRYEVLPLTECHLLSPEASRLVPALSAWLEATGLAPFEGRTNEGVQRTLTVREGKRTGERMLEWTTSHADPFETVDGPRPAAEVAAAFAEAAMRIGDEVGAPITSVWWTRHRAVRGERTRLETHHIAGRPGLRERLDLVDGHSLSFEIHPRAFFQPNTGQAEVIYRQVIDASGVQTAPGTLRVLDLYCGTGTIGLCLAPWAREVVGVELVPDAVENATRNAEANGIGNARFFAGDAAEVVEAEQMDAPGAFDVVVVDPPRAGLHEASRALVARIGAPRVVYVSCNPETLARDLAALTRAGYDIDHVVPVDQFAHTPHVECVATLTRRTNPDSSPS